jgi:Fe2+ or Zn2+ uptake regulation protein
MTASIPREKKILEILQEQEYASIQELVETLGVSNMTIHRDLNKLTETGQVQKKHGGVVLSETHSPAKAKLLCSMCNKPISERTIFIIRLESGEQKHACCAHCGLFLQSETKKVVQSLTADYLHGHMVSTNQAVYVVGSDLNICCVPSAISFGSQQEAEKFQKGFGGRLATMKEALQLLKG